MDAPGVLSTSAVICAINSGIGVLEHDFRLVLDRDQIFQPAFADHPALENDADVIADFLHLFEQVGAQEHRDAALAELEDQIADLPRAHRIHPGGRFVENDQPRLLDERLRQADALEHAFRIAADPAVARAFEIDQCEQFVHPVLQRLAAQPAEFAVETQGFRRR